MSLAPRPCEICRGAGQIELGSGVFDCICEQPVLPGAADLADAYYDGFLHGRRLAGWDDGPDVYEWAELVGQDYAKAKIALVTGGGAKGLLEAIIALSSPSIRIEEPRNNLDQVWVLARALLQTPTTLSGPQSNEGTDYPTNPARGPKPPPSPSASPVCAPSKAPLPSMSG